ncbi:unnamed protein product [Pleuronectes platessa]|uniref:Uncharacterized protein n=1 Tax=Pleuronectes platessa TaxID=8262 RepID=A0A9N7W053_PLEPL|nr:unnamed protein product [Pleuronectes platessa]
MDKALQGTMEEDDEEDLLDLFTRMGSHFLPPKEGMKAAIETMAHKAILQEPKFIVDCFSTPMSQIKHTSSYEVIRPPRPRLNPPPPLPRPRIAVADWNIVELLQPLPLLEAAGVVVFSSEWSQVVF